MTSCGMNEGIGADHIDTEAFARELCDAHAANVQLHICQLCQVCVRRRRQCTSPHELSDYVQVRMSMEIVSAIRRDYSPVDEVLSYEVISWQM